MKSGTLGRGSAAALNIAFGFLLVWTACADAELDFSPQLKAYEQEGIKMSQLAFRNGKNPAATYQPPRDWKYRGGSGRLDLQPADLPQSKASLTKWPPSPALALDAEGQKALTERIIELLPEGSEQVRLVATELNPLRINGKQTFLVELTYVFYGQRFASYSLLVERKDEPLCFHLSCRESDYPKLRAAFHQSLFSWQNL